MNRSVALLLILVLTVSSIVWVFSVKAEYSGTITIDGDGSVNPSISSIKQSGNTYFLTTDIAGNITVQKSNIVFDGNGYKVDSSCNWSRYNNGCFKCNSQELHNRWNKRFRGFWLL
jgi:hypothetical protein